MIMSTTINYLQEYIKSKDNHPELVKDYFLKLTEETGELSEAVRKNKIRIDNSSVKVTLTKKFGMLSIMQLLLQTVTILI